MCACVRVYGVDTACKLLTMHDEFLLFQALDGFLMIVDHMGTVLYVSDDSVDYISLTPVSVCPCTS